MGWPYTIGLVFALIPKNQNIYENEIINQISIVFVVYLFSAAILW